MKVWSKNHLGGGGMYDVQAEQHDCLSGYTLRGENLLDPRTTFDSMWDGQAQQEPGTFIITIVYFFYHILYQRYYSVA